ncbi:MAG: hypothetical protein L0214_11620 [candidate division NC10 bacterium]|nr:hypothetical protein [candidate division NC10 bacterium]
MNILVSIGILCRGGAGLAPPGSRHLTILLSRRQRVTAPFGRTLWFPEASIEPERWRVPMFLDGVTATVAFILLAVLAVLLAEV